MTKKPYSRFASELLENLEETLLYQWKIEQIARHKILEKSFFATSYIRMWYNRVTIELDNKNCEEYLKCVGIHQLLICFIHNIPRVHNEYAHFSVYRLFNQTTID